MTTALIVGRPDPYTVVVIEGIRLGAYAAGGVNVSVGELAAVDFAFIGIGKASGAGAGQTSGPGFNFFVTSGSGNVVTIKIMGTGSGEAPANIQTSSFPLFLMAFGH